MREESIPTMAIHLATTNDRNGNPRRVFVVLDQYGDHMDAIDEGYNGTAALRGVYLDVPLSGRIVTTPGEYREFLRLYAAPRNRGTQGEES